MTPDLRASWSPPDLRSCWANEIRHSPLPSERRQCAQSSRRPLVAAFPEPDVRAERNRKLTRRMDHAIPVWLPDHAIEVSTVPKRAAGPGSLKQDLNSTGDEPKRL